MVVGEEFAVDGDGADDAVLVGGDWDALAAADCDIFGWRCFFVVFVRVQLGEGVAGTVGVEMRPHSGDALSLNCSREKGEGDE